MAFSSVYWTVLNSILNAVQDLNLMDWNGNPLPSAIRKLPKKEEILDTLPMLIVAPQEEPPKVIPEVFGPNVFVWYTTNIAFVAAGNRDFTTNHLDAYMYWHQSLRRIFQGASLDSLAPLVFDSDISPELIMDRRQLNQSYDYGGIAVRYKCDEPRTTV